MKISFFLLIFSFCSLSIKTQTLDDVLNKFIDKVGGLENWEKIWSYSKISITDFEANGNFVKNRHYFVEKKPNFSYSKIGNDEGFTIIGYDGENLWTKSKEGKPEFMPEFVRKKHQDAEFRFAESLIVPIFIQYKDKSYTINLLGEKLIDNKFYFEVYVQRLQFTPQYYYFDKANYLIFARAGESLSSFINPNNMEFFTDYRKVNGITIPFYYEQWQSGNLMFKSKTIQFEVNPKINDVLFKFEKHK